MAALAVLIMVAACGPPPGGGGGGNGHGPPIRLNEIQVVATHNSYKIEPEPALHDALLGVLGEAANGFQYTHLPFAEQFDLGARQVELDVFVDDPQGGRYAEPAVIDLLGLEPMDSGFAEPGLKTFHVQEVDYRSRCPQFTTCLEQIRAWSDAHPDHLPITIQIEPKDDEIPDPVDLGFVQPVPWSEDSFADLDTSIRAVFPDEQVITPATVQGDHPTLRDAVESGRGWPTLREARGKVMFTLDHTGAKREMYRSLHPDVNDRLLFVAAQPPDDDAAVVVLNDPVGQRAQIEDLVSRGYIVRTRADADTAEARSGDTARRDAAWESGAQFVSTDYIVPDERFGTGYVVEVPGGGVARCNPVSATPKCKVRHLAERGR